MPGGWEVGEAGLRLGRFPAAMPGEIAHGMYTKMISLTFQLVQLQHMRRAFRTRITMKDMRACVVLYAPECSISFLYEVHTCAQRRQLRTRHQWPPKPERSQDIHVHTILDSRNALPYDRKYPHLSSELPLPQPQCFIHTSLSAAFCLKPSTPHELQPSG